LSDLLKSVEADLRGVGQEHVLRFLDRGDASAQAAFLKELSELDLHRIQGLVERVLGEEIDEDGALEPPAVMGWGDAERDGQARAAGEQLLSQGKVGAFLVAGGQGTRLGYDGPKGRFPVGPLSGRSLFAYHAHRVLAASRRHGAQLPFYVMTSRANNESTVAAFEEAGWFGLDPGQVFFLVQGMLPAIDRQGKLLLSSPTSLSMSPDGHGGCFRALSMSGALDDMQRRGIEQLFYFQVDNPLAQVLDPVFIGHHVLARAEMSTKVVEKTEAAEKVGVLAQRNGQTCLAEYSDLDAELAAERTEDGKLLYRAGNIAIHMLDLAFVQRLLDAGNELPVHRADKKVPCLDGSGQLVEPERPNAIKMEMFVFDALPLAERVTTQEVLRRDEFAPVKNAEGADSPGTCTAALVDQAKRWMKAAGLAVPEGPAEVGPLFALDQEAFRANLTHADFGPVFDRSV
jgi:UDP-N-acetylglucosamine/UDP-N-acetylgalactosamine diphosphorylase